MAAFPMPFGSISQVRQLTPMEMRVALDYIVNGCGGKHHMHNFAVEMDHSYVGRHLPLLFGTPLLMECIAEVLV